MNRLPPHDHTKHSDTRLSSPRHESNYHMSQRQFYEPMETKVDLSKFNWEHDIYKLSVRHNQHVSFFLKNNRKKQCFHFPGKEWSFYHSYFV